MCNGTEHPHVLGLVWSFVGTIPSNPRGQTLRETEAESFNNLLNVTQTSEGQSWHSNPSRMVPIPLLELKDH